MAVENMTEAELRHAEVPCLGMGLNREYDRDQPRSKRCLTKAGNRKSLN